MYIRSIWCTNIRFFEQKETLSSTLRNLLPIYSIIVIDFLWVSRYIEWKTHIIHYIKRTHNRSQKHKRNIWVDDNFILYFRVHHTIIWNTSGGRSVITKKKKKEHTHTPLSSRTALNFRYFVRIQHIYVHNIISFAGDP